MLVRSSQLFIHGLNDPMSSHQSGDGPDLGRVQYRWFWNIQLLGSLLGNQWPVRYSSVAQIDKWSQMPDSQRSRKRCVKVEHHHVWPVLICLLFESVPDRRNVLAIPFPQNHCRHQTWTVDLIQVSLTIMNFQKMLLIFNHLWWPWKRQPSINTPFPMARTGDAAATVAGWKLESTEAIPDFDIPSRCSRLLEIQTKRFLTRSSCTCTELKTFVAGIYASSLGTWQRWYSNL